MGKIECMWEGGGIYLFHNHRINKRIGWIYLLNQSNILHLLNNHTIISRLIDNKQILIIDIVFCLIFDLAELAGEILVKSLFQNISFNFIF